MFDKNLQRVMVEKGVSPVELSRATGIGKSSISQYLSGKNVPSKERICVIADALGVGSEDLIKTAKPELTVDGRRKVYNLRVRIAAELLGVSDDFVYRGLRAGVFPWGYAVKMSSVWWYYINAKRFAEVEGIRIPEQEVGVDA